jgi:hypothetical protein
MMKGGREEERPGGSGEINAGRRLVFGFSQTVTCSYSYNSAPQREKMNTHARRPSATFSALAEDTKITMTESNVEPVSRFLPIDVFSCPHPPLPPSSQIRTLDKSGNEITHVGFQRFGFDCEVPLDVVRSLYLRPHYVITEDSAGEQASLDSHEAVNHARFTKGHAAYQSKSIYHPHTQSISYTTLTRFPPVKLLAPSQRKRVLITGGAGFVGSHLVDRLMLLGHEVTVIDNFFTGSKTSVSHWTGHPNFELVRHDVVEPFMIECDRA